MEPVQAQLPIAGETLQTQSVDSVRPGVGGDALNLGEGGLQVLQHLDHAVGIHQDAVAVLEKDGLHAALDPVVGHVTGLLLTLGLGIARLGHPALENVHPILDAVDILLDILRRADAEGNVTVKAAEAALVPAAAAVDAQQQAVGLAGGADGAQLKACVGNGFLQAQSSFNIESP